MSIMAILRHKGADVASVPPEASIAEVAHLLTSMNIGAVVVLDGARNLQGILSERDVLRSLARHGAATLDMTASQLMTRVLHTVSPRQTAGEAMRLMTASRVRHLPVLDEGRMVGLVSIGDVVKAQLDAQAQEVDSLKAYVAGSV